MKIIGFKCDHQIFIIERGIFKDSIGPNQRSVEIGTTTFKKGTDHGN